MATMITAAMNGNGKTRDITEIQDTWSAASYMAVGHRPTRMIGYGTRKRFVFEHLPEEVIEAVETDALLVNAARFKSCYRELLSWLRQSGAALATVR